MDATQIQKKQLIKAKTGISGLDEITHGGLPAGRPTLVCGGPGSGKTLLGIAFLVKGATEFAEPGVLMSFEENADELAQDVASLGYDLARLVDEKKLVVDYVHIDRSEIEETGEFDLDGLFVRLDTRSILSAPNASSSTRSSRCSPASKTRRFSAPSCGGSFAGCAIAISPR